MNMREFRKNITELNIHEWMPYHNRPVHVQISGEKLWKIFQRSATGLGKKVPDPPRAPADRKPDWGQFLQVSREIKVVYKKSGRRNLQIKIAPSLR